MLSILICLVENIASEYVMWEVSVPPLSGMGVDGPGTSSSCVCVCGWGGGGNYTLCVWMDVSGI